MNPGTYPESDQQGCSIFSGPPRCSIFSTAGSALGPINTNAHAQSRKRPSIRKENTESIPVCTKIFWQLVLKQRTVQSHRFVVDCKEEELETPETEVSLGILAYS